MKSDDLLSARLKVVPTDLANAGASPVQVRHWRPSRAQAAARATNWLYACIAGALGSLSAGCANANLPQEDAVDLGEALRALKRIDDRRVARQLQKTEKKKE